MHYYNYKTLQVYKYKHCCEIIEDLSGNALGIEAAEAGLKFGWGCFMGSALDKNG